MFNKKLLITISMTLSSTLVSCSSSNQASPSAVVTQFNNAVKSAGTQLQSTSLSGALSSGLTSKNALADVDDVCDENATPMDGSDYMDQNDPEYSARLFYCKVVKDSGSPESIPGSYGQTKSIACALEKAGIVYDGEEHTATVSVDSDCFTPEELDDEMPSSIEMTYKASRPASFNSNFQTGVEMTIPDFGTFVLATSVEGSLTKFMGYENQGSTKTGVYLGQFDSESGEIRFEGRHDRINCNEEGSCGWTKHDRIYLKCASINSDGECEDIQEVQGASSDIFNTPSMNGRLATISGDFSVGVRTRFYSNNEGDFNDPEKWTQNASAAEQCYTLESPTAGDCSSNLGIRISGTSPFFFTLYDGYIPNDEWYQEIEGLSFTSIDLVNDIL